MWVSKEYTFHLPKRELFQEYKYAEKVLEYKNYISTYIFAESGPLKTPHIHCFLFQSHISHLLMYAFTELYHLSILHALILVISSHTYPYIFLRILPTFLFSELCHVTPLHMVRRWLSTSVNTKVCWSLRRCGENISSVP